MLTDNSIYIREYTAPTVDFKEICRYFGSSDPSSEERELIDECIKLAIDSFTYKVCYRELPVVIAGKDIDIGFIRLKSVNLARNLTGCDKVVLFSATVGIEIDRLITRYSRISPARSVCLQAIGAERIEVLCDTFCNDLKDEYMKRGCSIKPRFSPGYGDLSLNCQKEIFRVLDCERKIGLTLTEGMLMMPSKSVTAFVGIRKGE